MFPNVRLMVGALFASVVALTCGFGLFATFRVNHEPLSRLPVGTAPIQFVANERTGWGTPFDGQSRLNGPQHSAIATDVPAAAPAHRMKAEAASTGTAEAIKPVVAAIPVIDTAPPRAIEQPAEVIEPIVSTTSAAPALPAPQLAPTPTTAVVVPNQTASVQSPSADTASPSATATGTIAATPSAPPSESEPQAGSAAPVVAEPSSAKPAEDEAVAKPDSDAGAAVKAAAPAIAAATPSDQPSVVAPPANEAGPAPDTLAAPANALEPVRKIDAKKDSKIPRKPVARRRIAIRRRVVRRVPPQNTGFGDPIFRSAPNYSSASASRSPASPSNW
jgi:hypothetical protein